MANGDDQRSNAMSHSVFAMDPEPTLRQLARHIVATQREMAALARYAHTQRPLATNNNHLKRLLAVWEDFQWQWVTQRLPSLIAAMRLTLEVYDTFGSGMIRLVYPIEAGIWNNKYFVWERELSPTLDVPDRYV